MGGKHKECLDQGSLSRLFAAARRCGEEKEPDRREKPLRRERTHPPPRLSRTHRTTGRFLWSSSRTRGTSRRPPRARTPGGRARRAVAVHVASERANFETRFSLHTTGARVETGCFQARWVYWIQLVLYYLYRGCPTVRVAQAAVALPHADSPRGHVAAGVLALALHRELSCCWGRAAGRGGAPLVETCWPGCCLL